MTFLLSPCGPLQVGQSGKIVEDLEILSDQGAALEIHNVSDVVVRRCRIWHKNGPGVRLLSCRRVHLEQLEIVRYDAPLSGPLATEECNLEAWNCEGLSLRQVRLLWGSSGLYLTECQRVHLQQFEGFDFRGPFPRGQLLQLNRVVGARVQHFFALNPPETSFPEDIVSVFESHQVHLSDGLLVGNNSPAGSGVMFEHSTQGRVLRVDAWHMGNGCFSAYPAHDVQFEQVRAARNHAGDQGRGLPLSGGLCFASSLDSTKIRVVDSHFDQISEPHRLMWGAFDCFQAEPRRLQPRSLTKLKLPWEEVRPSRG